MQSRPELACAALTECVVCTLACALAGCLAVRQAMQLQNRRLYPLGMLHGIATGLLRLVTVNLYDH